MMNMLENYELHFSGHETFPIRQLWLLKAYTFALNHSTDESGAVFSGDDAMVELGVGKNMVSSMRFWGDAVGILSNKHGSTVPSSLGHLIFGELDPNCEHPSTPWFVHWQLSCRPSRSTVFWYLFNQVNAQTMSREDFQVGLTLLANKAEKKISSQTIKRDVEVCLRSYVPFLAGRNKAVTEEFVEPLLASLGIVKVISKDVFSIPRSSRPTLSNGLFAFALIDFWLTRPGNTATLDFFQITHAIGSPGKVFRIDENSLARRLEDLESFTNGELVWSEQSGIKAVIRRNTALNNPEVFKEQMLRLAYE